jgi:hypothetical protein
MSIHISHLYRARARRKSVKAIDKTRVSIYLPKAVKEPKFGLDEKRRGKKNKEWNRRMSTMDEQKKVGPLGR